MDVYVSFCVCAFCVCLFICFLFGGFAGPVGVWMGVFGRFWGGGLEIGDFKVHGQEGSYRLILL